MPGEERSRTTRPRRRDIGRIVARLLCLVFAVVGALPVAAAVLVRSSAVTRWAAAETARILDRELGVKASYEVEVRLWPLEVSVSNIALPASDGRSAFFEAERVGVRPRIFSLLAGRLDAGDIEIEAPRVRVVLRDGKLVNLGFRAPESREGAPELKRAPFSSVAVTGATVELDVDGTLVKAGPLDVDVFADAGPTFDVSLRAAESEILRPRKVEIVLEGDDPDEKRVATTIAYDEDVVCRLEARARIEPGNLLVRRLSLLGVADPDPKSGTRPKCRLSDDENDPNQVAVRLSQLRVAHEKGKPKLVDGHIVARAPASLANRFVRMGPLRGWVGFVGTVHLDPTTTLPELRGKIRGRGIQLAGYKLAKHLEVDVEIIEDRVLVPRFEMGFADGVVVVTNVRVDPLLPGAPLSAERVDGSNVAFESMMRDLDVTPNTIIKWDLKKTRVTKLAGTLDPLKIDGEMYGESRDFEVFNRAYHDPARKHMIGVRGAATVRGKIGVRPSALEFYDTRAEFHKSVVHASLVSIGFHNDLKLRVGKGTRIRLADISPLVDIPMAGDAELFCEMGGKANDPVLTGEVKIADFEFGGFPLGDIKSAKLRFRPLILDLTEVQGRKGRSDYVVPSARLDFDRNATLIVDAQMKSEKFDVRDFMAMWHFDEDPRFDAIHGENAINARVHYALDGPEDRCGGGALRVDGTIGMRRLELFEERYDSGEASFDFRWSDRDASYMGFDLEVPSISLRKGSGTLLGSFSVQRGGIVRGHLVGTAVPLAKIDAMGTLGLAIDSRLSAVAQVSGTVDALKADASVRLSPLKLGNSTLPASDFSVKLEPIARPQRVVGKTRCGQPITGPFERAEYDADHASGVFHIDGALFGEQIRMSDLRITRQRNKTVRGDVAFNELDLGTIAELGPGIALTDSRPTGTLSGKLSIEEFPLEHAEQSRAKLTLTKFGVEQGGFRAKLEPGAQPIVIRDGRLDMHGLTLALKTPRGHQGLFDLQGSVTGLGRSPEVDAVLALRPTELSAFASLMPRAERVKGRIDGKLRVNGPVGSLRYRGGFALRGGEIFVRGMPAPVSDIELAIDVDSDEVRISRGSARVGSGTLRLSGSAPLRGFELGAVRAVITARELSLPVQDGVKATIDADLVASWKAPDSDGIRPLPHVTGDVQLRTFEYTRPVTMTADISSLAQRGKRTAFEAYDPDDDFIEFDVTMRSSRALKLRNNLIEAELELEPDGLLLAGSNQRFGLRGNVRLKPGGRIRLRQNEFEVRQGHVRFDDLTRVAPQVDVTAVTEYRRYTEASAADGPGSRAPDATSSSNSTNVSGGRWHITMHAYGDAEKLRIDLTSEPALAQDDIFLLLTVGLTRAELDQAQSASVGESVALEALGTLTGADRAVKSAVPVIDEFRFGSAYSSRTGRTEPTVTIGKRLAERIRANVTSGLADSREVRSNLEWRLSPRVSVEGSYDNVNDISSSSLGNLGADVRWRLEFE